MYVCRRRRRSRHRAALPAERTEAAHPARRLAGRYVRRPAPVQALLIAVLAYPPFAMASPLNLDQVSSRNSPQLPSGLASPDSRLSPLDQIDLKRASTWHAAWAT